MNKNISKVTDEFLVWFKLSDGLFLDGEEFYEKAIDAALVNEKVLGSNLDVIIGDIHRVLKNM